MTTNSSDENNSNGGRSSHAAKESWPPPVIRNGRVEFSAESVHEQLVCPLCSGFFRDPVTTTKCRHTFCRSCLVTAVDAGRSNCPQCQTYLGADIDKFSQPDHVLRVVVDKVLFPDVAADDAAREAAFYRRRGIDRKVDPSSSDSGDDGVSSPPRKKSSGEVTLAVVPDDQEDTLALPPLKCPLLRTENILRIGQIKKYLQLQLKLDGEDLEVLCHGTPLGDELSVSFILRTVWMEHNKSLVLTYRKTSSGKEPTG